MFGEMISRGADQKAALRRGGGYMDYGYGFCTENGWLTKSLDEI